MCLVFQAIPPFEFAFKDERITLTIVGAEISPPTVPKGTICKELNVYPAECRGRRSTYRGRLMVSASREGPCPQFYLLRAVVQALGCSTWYGALLWKSSLFSEVAFSPLHLG